jgi:DNA polymerase III sliding clamp (beta) subunit (PCNA family)
MPAKTAKIVLALGGSWEIFGLGLTDLTDEYFLWLALVREDGTTVTFRAIDARFPDYRVVIPEGKGMVNMEIDKDILLTELKNAGKFANTSTNQVTFSMNDKLRISSADIDFDREYKVDILCGEEMNLKFSKKYTDQWLYEGKPVTITQDLGEFVQITGRDVVVPKTELIQQGAEFHICFNYRFLQEVAHKVPIGEKVRFKMWAPTKAAIINDNFLVMPLMLNI